MIVHIHYVPTVASSTLRHYLCSSQQSSMVACIFYYYRFIEGKSKLGEAKRLAQGRRVSTMWKRIGNHVCVSAYPFAQIFIFRDMYLPTKENYLERLELSLLLISSLCCTCPSSTLVIIVHLICLLGYLFYQMELLDSESRTLIMPDTQQVL